MMTLLPEDQSNVGPPVPPPAVEKPFSSLAADAIENEFKRYQNHTVPLAERVRAGHRFLSAAANQFAKISDDMPDGVEKTKLKELSEKLVKFVKTYVAPRVTSQVVMSGDDIPVYRISVSGPLEFTMDVAPNDFNIGLQAVKDQVHEDYYNSTLAPIVGFTIVMLAKHEVIPERDEYLLPTFGSLTAPLGSVSEESIEEEDEDA